MQLQSAFLLHNQYIDLVIAEAFDRVKAGVLRSCGLLIKYKKTDLIHPLK